MYICLKNYLYNLSKKLKTMAEVLQCTSCGGTTQIPEGKASFFCSFCGTLIEKTEPKSDITNIDESSRISNFILLASNAQESGNYDEAILYYNKVLELNPKSSEAWFGKGYCAGWSTNLSNVKINEMVKNFSNALDNTPENIQNKIKNDIVSSINGCASAIYKLSYNHTIEYISVDDTYEEHLDRMVQVLNALEYAHSLIPSSTQVLDSLVKISSSLLEPIKYTDYNKKFQTCKLNDQHKKIITDFNIKYSSMLVNLDKDYAKSVEKQGKQGKQFKTLGIIFLSLGGLITLTGVSVFLGLVILIVGLALTLKGSKMAKQSKSIISKS